MKWAIIFIAIVILLSLLDLYNSEDSEVIGNPFAAYFCPRQDCMMPLLSSIESAKLFVHCAFYEIDSKELVDLLAKKSRSIDVKLVVDEGNITGAKKAPEKKTMHNKFCIIDGSTAITGSLNPTEKGIVRNNNNLLIIKSKKVAKNYENEFQELWSGVFDGGEKTSGPGIKISNISIETYFCPEDYCEDKVVREIRKAKSSIYFMAFSFTSNAIADEIRFSNARHFGIVEKSQHSKYSSYGKLNAKFDNNKYLIHHKDFLIY